MRANSIKLAALHLMAVLLTIGCLFNADIHSERELFLLPAGALMVVVVGTLKDLFLQIRQDIQRRG
jgi:hypothetical protein